ncbi:alpha-N-arabinofuranosidase [Parabacteroides sp. PFB2-10]|uniref:alpha-L-arabinofuranosidase C-terminal domain-containing protein n=1 Tax=Parabacteroides sp. PFB2-10 TaxID=1742405 RepID=UPI00247694F8|nr:alpha-L-arabinofuranosidase C-terminal domain-containing protein [Parabacteroides sp. PFB2-10]MDH6312433.1 alpha-N-arabinofuranosidase [Parabacteroides sp. PFB2-10]
MIRFKKINLLFFIFLMAGSSFVFAGNEKQQPTETVSNRVSRLENREKIKYNPMIFGQFIEHFDNQVYGGIYDPGSKFSDEDGFRIDVMEALKELKMPIIRWPGGCFVSTYHWLDGVGPERTPVYDKTWQVEDPNTFGTDEFIKWCRKVGTEPYICTNAGTGTPEEMSDWVEYCNLTVGKFGRMRANNGHPEPYDVKYWSVGNENWGGHELGARTVEEWGPMVRESAKLMRSVTKDLKLFAAATSNKDWTMPLLKAAGQHLDYISVHGYWDPAFHVNNISPYLECMMRTERPEEDIQRTINILEEAGFADRIKIAYDEWNLRNWHHPWHGDFRRGFELEARRKNDIQSTYTMADALFSACFLNSCLRNADYVEIACFSPVVNTRGAIFVHPEGILKRTTFHTLYMYANWLEAYIVPVESSVEKLTSGTNSTNVLDVILTSDEAGKRYVYAIVNKDPKRDIDLTLDFEGLGKKAPKTLNGQVLSGKSPDDYNDIGAENRVVPEKKSFKVKNGAVTLPPHSLTFITVE